MAAVASLNQLPRLQIRTLPFLQGSHQDEGIKGVSRAGASWWSKVKAPGSQGRGPARGTKIPQAAGRPGTAKETSQRAVSLSAQGPAHGTRGRGLGPHLTDCTELRLKICKCVTRHTPLPTWAPSKWDSAWTKMTSWSSPQLCFICLSSPIPHVGKLLLPRIHAEHIRA